MSDILFQYYGSDIRNTTPLGCVSLDYWIESMRNPKPEFKHIFKKIQIASLSNNKAEKDELKRHLYFFTPAVLVNSKRRYSDISRFTGLLTVDFDGLEIDYAKEFKEALFKEYKFTIEEIITDFKEIDNNQFKSGKIKSSLEVTKKELNYDKINQIFAGQKHNPTVINRPTTISQPQPKTNSEMIQKLMGKKRNR
jgi:hypothetical protein